MCCRCGYRSNTDFGCIRCGCRPLCRRCWLRDPRCGECVHDPRPVKPPSRPSPLPPDPPSEAEFDDGRKTDKIYVPWRIPSTFKST